MTKYAYVKDNEVKRTGSLPTSWKNYSNFPGQPIEVLVAEGFYPITYDNTPTLQLDQYLGAETFEIRALDVRSYRPVITRTLDELKVWLKQKGEEAAKRLLEEEYDLQMQIVALSGVLGTNYRQAVLDRITYFIGAYQTFSGEVDACTTKPQLLVVYNNYSRFFS